jgi:predicted nicotinamide N-methyase
LIEPREFVLRHTRLQRPDRVPELRLHLADDITPLWRLTEEEALPFWAFAWAGGQALARYVLDNPEEVAGKTVLDVATGSGLCALAALKAGAASALAADVDRLSAVAVALNAAANALPLTFTPRNLLDAEPPSVDVILAGDCCYERAMAERVLAWLERAHRCGLRVLIGDPGRPYFPADRLVRLASYEVPTSRDLEDADAKLAGVFTFPASEAAGSRQSSRQRS